MSPLSPVAKIDVAISPGDDVRRNDNPPAHTWSVIHVGGAFHSQYCALCHRVRLRNHEFGSNKKLGWQSIGACVAEDTQHSFEPYMQESGLLRVCTACFVQQKYGRKFGTGKSCGFETVHAPCTPSQPTLRAVYEQVIAKFPEYVPAEEVHTQSEGLVADLRVRLEELQVQPVKSMDDFCVEFPRFSNLHSDLLREALTHPTADYGKNYLRLAFLGDAVVELFVIDKLFTVSPPEDNGTITVKKSQLVANHMLSVHALPYLAYLRRGLIPDTDTKAPCDVLKALIGAYHIQWGYDHSRELCMDLGIVRRSTG
ncbi:hypothetical protein SARC_02326 [Sphaeroforma arctica JP610]|uniref:RNase III domain-containing protein n=1 Tax=Sphaeroforma arctica JP610 TaxID=667725 RepID=A0A0L0G994_9EUKA|nr:hypothetical protein SARC_02326 [Sphaeroforma arctica JP610]KNC85489.1 hypothetical protein SARC_02326 [Sphaeroforma arctica JP610]|eukprot:XP_014159391.1 hypothetical protein SARC_02326 [Sphaeroforma arctica JP610]